MGGSRKIRKGKGVLASYRGTIYFTENSLKIIQNFTERGGGGSNPRPARPVCIIS